MSAAVKTGPTQTTKILFVTCPVLAALLVSPTAFAQNAADFQELVARLPANAIYAISPPSLKGAPVAFYADPKTNAYFVAPMLLPDWDALRAGIAQNCEGKSPSPLIEVKMQLEFGRDTIREEIATVAARKERKDITKDQIFSFPYAWISVRTGAKAQLNVLTQKFPVRTIAEYPPDVKNSVEKRALMITSPEPYLAHIWGSCEELRYILENRDITGDFYAPTKSTQVNAFSVEYKNFAKSEQFKNLTRDETATGSEIVVSRAASKGAGINIGGHFGAKTSEADGKAEKIDTRTRTVSANLISDSGMTYSESLPIKNWVEFEGQNVTKERVADELMKFVMRNSIPVNVQIARNDKNGWDLITPTQSRSLTSEQMKQVVESSSKLDLDFSEKVTIGCPEKSEGGSANPYCGSGDKKFKGVDDNGIKWTQDGQSWIPTSMTLYAVSTDKLEQASNASIVDVLVKDGGMRVGKLQPVAVDLVPGSDLSAIIAKEVSGLKSQVNSSLAKLATFKPGTPISFDTTAVRGGPGTRNPQNCPEGQFVAGLNPYLRQGLSPGPLQIVLNCMSLPVLQIP